MAIYSVRSGDTLGKISSKHGISLDDLLEINPQIDNPNLIVVGQIINLNTESDDLGDDEDEELQNVGDAPKWYLIALREEGVSERAGSAHNPRIIEYHNATSYKASTDEVPWCSSFANWCMREAGLKGTNSAAARSWLKWGKEISEPVLGCIVIFSRPPNPAHGHVGFYAGETSTHILTLGGNQSNTVRVSGYRKSRLLGYRLPN